MQLFLLAVIMRQVAILISLLLGYGIYKLWISEKIAKKYTNLTISVYMTLLICALVTVAVLWFRDALDYISNDYMLFVLNSSYNFITLEAMIGILIFGVGLSIITFIISSGQPNKGVITLLQRLIKQGTKLLYHGDMDPAGLTIASHIQNQVPMITPFMTVSEYMSQKKYPLDVSQPEDINPTFRPLLTLIQNNKQCVFEEQLDLNKCQVYYDLMI